MAELLTSEELSEVLRIPHNRVIFLARRGELPSFKVDGRLRFDAAEIEGWLKAQREDCRRAPRLVEQ